MRHTRTIVRSVVAGLDYHIPVEGGTGTLPGLYIAHIAVEMAPIAKVGGMGDVVTALARAVQVSRADTLRSCVCRKIVVSSRVAWVCSTVVTALARAVQVSKRLLLLRRGCAAASWRR